MPYRQEHAARMVRPSKYGKMRRGHLGKGIDVIYGIKDSKAEIQAYRFDRTKWTPSEAQAWLKSHGKKPIRFEAARK